MPASAKSDLKTTDVIAPNFKRRLSGVTATIVRLVPLQAQQIAIAATGPVLPDLVPQVPLRQLPFMSRKGPGPSGFRVWHARRNVEMIAGLVLKYLLGKRLKLVFTSASQRQQSKLTRWLIRRMDAVVATSGNTAAYLENTAQVIMHGIDLNSFTPPDDKNALRQTMGLPEQGLLIGCYGRIRAQKGTDAFVHAMLQVCSDQPNVTALVMGRATEKYQAFEADLRKQVARAGLSERILFKPEVPTEAMADWYRVLDLYIAPQRWEGFGLTPIEAMACACPVIATRVGAFEELILEGQTGALIDPGDIDGMASATNTILSDPKKLANWSITARSHVVDNFSIESEANALVSLYRGLLQPP
ncbi:MAG: glycosyltransferase family 4 protein [Paracoccaceae bacterium]